MLNGESFNPASLVIEYLSGNTTEARDLYMGVLDIDRRTGQPFLDEFRRYPEFRALEEAFAQ